MPVALIATLAALAVGHGTPVMEATQPWEQHAVYEPTVIYSARRELYRMWYSGGWDKCSMGYADSRDGVHWNKHDGPVIENACQNNVAYIDGVYYAYFDRAGSTGLSVAESTDGLAWRVQDQPAVAPTGDAVRLVNSTIWRDGDSYRMLVESDSPDNVWRTWNAEGATPTSLHITGEADFGRGGMFGGPWRDSGTVYFHASATGNLPTDIYADDGGAIRLVLAHDGSWWQTDQVADPSIANGLLFFDGVDNSQAVAAIGVTAAP